MIHLSIEQAADILRNSGVILYPTETYFGIGCRAGADTAIARIFQIKRRLYAMPLPLVLADWNQLPMVANVPYPLQDDITTLRKHFWPGPLSMVIPAKPHLSPLLTGGTGKIAVRISPHPAPLQLAALAGEPLVASSANISGQQPVTQSALLDPEIVKAVDGIVDMEPVPTGEGASTLVEPLGNGTIRILRLGNVDTNALQNAGFKLEVV